MDLHQRLTEMMELRPVWYRALLEKTAAHLNASALRNVQPPGNPMPDFVLPDADGELVFSDDLLARGGPLVVNFVRGGWCPFCLETLSAWQSVLPELQALGATVVAITPDIKGFAAARQSLGLGYAVLADVDNAVGLRFGGVFRAPDDYRAALLTFGIDLSERNGGDGWFLPMPSTFVADRDGILRYSHASGDITDRPDPSALLAVVRDLSASQPVITAPPDQVRG